uniref:Uncharacterized protein n=1 Tax=Ananas comosus var. bracteatus TaxID=296719 RepID=A0A6V7NEE5_ANACO|nr:unnamed protein product [Ananas comosus var. bracteatus]
MAATTTTATTMLAQRLWCLLRKALLWARKGGALNRRLVADLRVVCNRLRSLRGGRSSSMLRYDELHYRECELSFAETPTFQLKMFKSKFRCINPAVDSDDEEHFEYKYDDDDDDDKNSDALYLEYDKENYECRSKHEDGSVDRKADEFIAKFYRQVRLQRELSMQKRQQNNAKKTE